MNPRVKEIVSINPYSIDALWSNDEVRRVDFGKFLSEYFEKENSVYFKILNETTFGKAKTDGRTIYWDGMTEMEDWDGKIIASPLDFCPDVLFEESFLIP